MKISINITDRNYAQISEFCEFNNMSIEDYIIQCVEDDFFTRKYGDLNEKINPTIKKSTVEGLKEEVKQIKEDKIEIDIKEEKKKRGRPKKTDKPKEISKDEEKSLKADNTFAQQNTTVRHIRTLNIKK